LLEELGYSTAEIELFIIQKAAFSYEKV
jgi:hypothetical protein